MPHDTNETLRKSIHIAFGFGAIALKYVTWQLAAAVCVVAIVGNWLVLHRIVGKRVARDARGWDPGIILYPAAVLALILVFNQQIEFAAIGWAILAFGDGFATVIGRMMPLAPLPWNREKSWGGTAAFVLFGGLGAAGIAVLFGRVEWAPVAAALIVAAVVESLPLGLNDNITVPLAAGGMLAAIGAEAYIAHEQPILWPWVVANTVLALAAYLLKSVDLSGAVVGWILGILIAIGGGPAMYVALLAFFIIGTACTKLGYKRKAAAGVAQEKGGRRGAAHAVANCGVAAVCAIATYRSLGLVPLFMGITALATAAADTTGSEIGQLLGRRAFLPLTLRRVEPGTEGAISIEGTLAGILAAFAVAIVGTTAAVHWFRSGFTGGVAVERSHVVATITICAFLGSYCESILGSRNRGRVPNGVLNFFNTAAGAVLFYVAAQFVPMFGFLF